VLSLVTAYRSSGRFRQARHPPRYAAFLRPPSPSFGHSSSLAALAAEVLDADPFSGAVLVFRSKRADRVKILVRDGSGLVLIWKQLEGSSFR
jgi:hypothetical protein